MIELADRETKKMLLVRGAEGGRSNKKFEATNPIACKSVAWWQQQRMKAVWIIWERSLIGIQLEIAAYAVALSRCCRRDPKEFDILSVTSDMHTRKVPRWNSIFYFFYFFLFRLWIRQPKNGTKIGENDLRRKGKMDSRVEWIQLGQNGSK